MALYKTINYSNDSGIFLYGNLFQGIPILQEDKLRSHLGIKLYNMCLCFSFKSHLVTKDTNFGPDKEKWSFNCPHIGET